MFQEASQFCPTNGFKARVDIEFLKDMLDVVVGGGAADVERGGNLTGGKAASHQFKDLQFTVGQFNGGGWGAGGGNQGSNLFGGKLGFGHNKIADQ